MYHPNWNDVPSEQTIEVQSNHFLLVSLNSPSAWIFCPTRVQEQRLGYDGSLQNGKILLIQYKRVHVNRNGSLNIRITATQHETLRDNFPAGNSPYVFYGFSIYPTYQELDADYHAAGAPTFFENMRFVNLHDLPADCNSITYYAPNDVRPFVNGVQQAPVAAIDGPELSDGILQCPVGLLSTDFANLVRLSSDLKWSPSTPHLSIVMLDHNGAP